VGFLTGDKFRQILRVPMSARSTRSLAIHSMRERALPQSASVIDETR
jgi:hypothetical protein